MKALSEDFISRDDLCKDLNIGKVTLWNWRKDPSFPKPFKIGKTLLWKKSEIESYIESTRK